MPLHQLLGGVYAFVPATLVSAPAMGFTMSIWSPATRCHVAVAARPLEGRTLLYGSFPHGYEVLIPNGAFPTLSVVIR